MLTNSTSRSWPLYSLSPYFFSFRNLSLHFFPHLNVSFFLLLSLSVPAPCLIYFSPCLLYFFLFLLVFFSVPGPGGWWFPLSRWPTLIIYWWQENRGRPSQLLLPGTQLSANTHTNKYRHIDSHNDSHTSMQLLKETHTLPHVKTHARNIFPFGSFLWCQRLRIALFYCQVWFCAALLHLLLPSTSFFLPPALLLSPPAVMLLTLSHRNRQKERQRAGDGENVRVVCKMLELANAMTINVLQKNTKKIFKEIYC